MSGQGYYDGMRDAQRTATYGPDLDEELLIALSVLRDMLDLGLKDPKLFSAEEMDALRKGIRHTLFSEG